MNKTYPPDREQQRIALRELMVKVYEDTLQTIKNDNQLKAAVKKSIESQQLYGEKDSIAIPKPTYLEQAHLKVTPLRTFEAAAQYQGQKVAVLNFASAVYPGGGVTIGSIAQEESLCRVSTLSLCLDNPLAWDKYYTPNRKALNLLYNDGIIYTKDVAVIKDDNHNLLTSPFYVDVITCAAPNLQETPSKKLYHGEPIQISREDLLELHQKRARKILSTAVVNNVEVLILGAFGCGAFRNDPNVVATAYKNVLSEYQYYFKTIEFAVYCPPSNQTNYLTFKKILDTHAGEHDKTKLSFGIT